MKVGDHLETLERELRNLRHDYQELVVTLREIVNLTDTKSMSDTEAVAELKHLINCTLPGQTHMPVGADSSR